MPPTGERINFFSARFGLATGIALAVAWLLLAMTHPLAWGIVNAVLLAIALGLLTTKVLLRFEQPAQIWGWTPLCGSAWVLLLWLLWLLTR